MSILSVKSTKALRDRGFSVAKVEQRLAAPGMHVTVDCFGFGDLLIMKPGWGTALVQVTYTGGLTEHERTARGCPELAIWLACGNRFILQGWAKRGARGKPKLWTMVEREITHPSWARKMRRVKRR